MRAENENWEKKKSEYDHCQYTTTSGDRNQYQLLPNATLPRDGDPDRDSGRRHSGDGADGGLRWRRLMGHARRRDGRLTRGDDCGSIVAISGG